MKIKFNESFSYQCKIALKKTIACGLMIAGASWLIYEGEQHKPQKEIVTEITSDEETNEEEQEENIQNDIKEEEVPLAKTIDNYEDHILVNDKTALVALKEIIHRDLLEPTTVSDTRKVVSLTFDDGPGRYTDRLLDILEENDSKATFFVLGCNIKKYSDAVKRAYDNKNEIGIHGYSHKYYTNLGVKNTQKEIDDTYNLLKEIDVDSSNIIRPPGMKYNKELVEGLDYSFILWSIDTRDWESRNKDKIKEEIMSKIQEGSIILLHDIHECSVDAIEELLPELTDEYRFVTISELFDILDIELEPNKVYRKVKVKTK